MNKQSIASFILINVLLLLLLRIPATKSVHHVNWTRSEIMDSYGLYMLEWKVVNKEIIFTTTVNTRGFIGLGFSYRHGKMAGSDLVLAWVDDSTGLPNVLVGGFYFFYMNFSNESVIVRYLNKSGTRKNI